VTWRDGVHITDTPIWCDARRRRDVCFLSSADRVGRTGHGQLIGTSITLALLGARDKGHLAVPLRQRFTLGTLRLELIPSGRGFGAAALHVDIAGNTVLYAGAVRTTEGGVGDAAELRTCDALVVAAPFGAPEHRFPPLAAEIEAAIEWTHRQLAADCRPVLLVDSVLDGLEVASRLAASGIAIAAGRTIREAAHRIADLVPPPQIIDGSIAIGRTIAPRPFASSPRAGRELRPADPGAADPAGMARLAHGSDRLRMILRPAAAADATSGVPALAAPGRELRATIWLDGDRAGLTRALARSASDRRFATALVSARAAAAAGGATGYDAGFVWAQAADRAQLLGWIAATGARDVFVTGACADSIVAALGGRARVIGPPQQMSLFPREAVP
jgi:putative mRNA 3-end processing factor